jgi:hypothetical protein
MHSLAAVRCGRAASDALRMRRMNLFLSVVALASWWETGYRQGAALGAGPHLPLAVAATLMLVARLASSAIEALAYVVWWRARGARLPYVAFLVALVALSLVDRIALDLGSLAGRTPALAPLLAPLAGIQLLRSRLPGGEPALWAAFGGLGLLTVARITITAWLQSAGTGRRLRAALSVTAAAWLASRIVVWWTLDLVRGASPLR